MEFTINKEIFDKVPTLNVGVIVLSNINNKAEFQTFFESEIKAITEKLIAKFDGEELSEYPVIKAWREIYKGFGEKKARSSIEALIRRIVNGKGLYTINPLVDLYNLASLTFELPCGGEDINTMNAPLELTLANGMEDFLSLGETEIEHPNTGEIIYKSGDIVVCRNFNYRESDITKLTENTTNAIIVFEDALGNKDNLQNAFDWLVDKVTKFLGAKVERTEILNRG